MQTPSGTPGGRPEALVGVHLKALNIKGSDLANLANPEVKGKGKERRDAILNAIVSEIQSSASHSEQKIPPKYKETLLAVMKGTPKTVMEFLKTFLGGNEERAALLVQALHGAAMENLRDVKLPAELTKGTSSRAFHVLAGQSTEAIDVRADAARMRGTLHDKGPVPPPPHWGKRAA
ncbi:hypothetical protein HZA42_04680 [Candidatus Peregrinibacteria bacterium]|nr:hypothetical protein [Candidatus Peregrinibacteria bacterium]